MAIWPHVTTRAEIDSYSPTVITRFYAKTEFASSNSWQQFDVDPHWTIDEKTNQGATLRCMPINDSLSFSDETNQANRQTLNAQFKVEQTIDGVTEIRFFGRVNNLDPEDIEFGIVAYDPFASWTHTQNSHYSEATRTALADNRDLVAVTKPGYSNIYGINTTAGGGDDAAFFEANTSLPRRPWALTGIIVKDIAAQIPSAAWEPLPELGLIRILDTNYTPDNITGVEVYLEDTLDISDPLKTIIQIADTAGGLNGSSADWTIARTAFTGSTDTIVIVTEGVRHLYPDHNVIIDGETRRIASRSLVNSTITLSVALSGAPANTEPISYDSLNIGVNLTKSRWSNGDGSNMDFYQRLLAKVAKSVILRFNPAEMVYELLRYQQAGSSEYDLRDGTRVVSGQARGLDGFYTRFIGTGQLEQPDNLCTDTTLSHVLGLAYPGSLTNDPIKQYIHGEVIFRDSGYPTQELDPFYWYDGDSNTTTGFHNSYAYTFQELVRFDFGSTREIRAISLVAAASQNSFEYGYRVEGSLDESTWFTVSPFLDTYLQPSRGVTIEEDQISTPNMRYLRVMVRPAKDGATNFADPYLGLAEIAVYERTSYEVIATIQDTSASPGSDVDVVVPFSPYVQTVVTYYPLTLEKLGGIHRTAPVQKLGNVLNAVKAQELMYILLDAAVKLYQQTRYTAVNDPYVRIGDTVTAKDALNGDVTMLVEHTSLTGEETIIEGTNYDATEIAA